jgi:xylan 1,4-beta-xylosidase
MKKKIFFNGVAAAVFFTLGIGQVVMSAPNPYANTFCNPVNVSYNFWAQTGSTPPSYREAADPGIIYFKNYYYLFASHSDCYWWSTDMANWNMVIPTGIKLTDYAPTVEVIGDTLFFTAGGSYLFKTTDPRAGVWTTAASTVLGSADPCLFRDDDGKFYCYFGCSANGVLEVVQADPARNFVLVGKKDTCVYSNRPDHGFENQGENNERLTNDSWIEGSWMTKYKGVYYLQYAVPGTEWRSYCDGCYTATAARGPYTFCPYSPISMRPQGFVSGTGHSCTFKDASGKYWHTTTVVISVAAMFERRLAIFPAGFDSANQLHTDTYLGDYPQYLPGRAPANSTSNLAGLMLLSFKKNATASSTLSGRATAAAFDENIKTWWSATTANSGEWLRVDLGKACSVAAIQTNFSEQDVTYAGGRGTTFSHKYRIEGATDTSGTWKMLVDRTTSTRDAPHDYVPLDSIVSVRYVRITNAGPMPGGGKFAVRDLRIFGNSSCNAPGGVTAFTVTRNAADQRMVTLTWSTVADAAGYIVRLGIAPDKLYNNYQILSRDSTTCVIRSLNRGVSYYFTVDAYSECGVRNGTIIKRDDNTTSIALPAPVAAEAKMADQGTFKVVGRRFVVPAGLQGKSYSMSVYDLSGKYRGGAIVKSGALGNLIDVGTEGAYIVRVKALTNR